MFSDIHLWASIFSVILVNYIFMDGKCDYFQGELSGRASQIKWFTEFDAACRLLWNALFTGTALVVVYLILLALYFFAPSPRSCWSTFQENPSGHENLMPTLKELVLHLQRVAKKKNGERSWNKFWKVTVELKWHWHVPGCWYQCKICVNDFLLLLVWNVNTFLSKSLKHVIIIKINAFSTYDAMPKSQCI